MFWTYNTTSSQIDTLLCKEDLSIYELLDQENVLQELKAQNSKLIEYLAKPEVMRELVVLITTEPSTMMDEYERYKYANLACELLTADLPRLNKRLVNDPAILDILYTFLEHEAPLNPLLAAYFSRTLSVLVSRKSGQDWFSYKYTCLQALEFLKTKEAFFNLVLKHLGTSSVMDLMHNLVTLIEDVDLKQSLRNWLQSENVINNLIYLLGPNIDEDRQINAASVICSIIQKIRETMIDLNDVEEDPILKQFESAETIDLLFKVVFDSEIISETSIECAVEVLLTIMQPFLPGEAQSRQMLHYSVHSSKSESLEHENKLDSEPNSKASSDVLSEDESSEEETVQPVIANIVKVTLPYVKKFRQVLTNPMPKDPIMLTSGLLPIPFGKARLLVTRFNSTLISLNNNEINKELINCDIPEVLLNLFYDYPSNNFLHAEVEKLIAYAIDGYSCTKVAKNPEESFIAHIFSKCNLLQRLLHIWNESKTLEKSGQHRRGYMGHVIRIASMIYYRENKSKLFRELMEKTIPDSVLNEWSTLKNTELFTIICMHSSPLGGVHPKLSQSSESNYEVNLQMTSRRLQDYKEDDDDDNIVMFSDDPSVIAYGEEGYSFTIETNEDCLETQAEMFKAVCAQKWQSFNKGLNNIADEDDNDNDYSWKDKNNSNVLTLWDSDEDEERNNGNNLSLDETTTIEAENNQSDPWSKLGNVSDPWSNEGLSSSDTNWANFDEHFGDTSDATACSTLATTAYESDKGWAAFDKRYEYGMGYEGHGEFNDIAQLESVSGSTLAEKLANAENDIRNECNMNMVVNNSQAILHNYMKNDDQIQNDNSDIVQKSDSSVMRFKQSETLNSEYSDCLTENSMDFVTADNSGSDAGSSVEFDDAENEEDIGTEELSNLTLADVGFDEKSEHKDTPPNEEKKQPDRETGDQFGNADDIKRNESISNSSLVEKTNDLMAVQNTSEISSDSVVSGDQIDVASVSEAGERLSTSDAIDTKNQIDGTYDAPCIELGSLGNAVEICSNSERTENVTVKLSDSGGDQPLSESSDDVLVNGNMSDSEVLDSLCDNPVRQYDHCVIGNEVTTAAHSTPVEEPV